MISSHPALKAFPERGSHPVKAGRLPNRCSLLEVVVKRQWIIWSKKCLVDGKFIKPFIENLLEKGLTGKAAVEIYNHLYPFY
jgi:hypothetical protein